MQSSRSFIVPIASFVVGLAILCGAFYFAFADRGPAAPAASAIGGPFKLEDGAGKTVTDADFKGEPFAVFFGYTHCPDVCPTTLSNLAEVLAKLPASAKFKVLFVTVDPERDTPAVMQDYVSSFDRRIIGLSGTRPEINAAIKEYHVYAQKVLQQDGDYSMDHSAAVYLMDKEGRFVAPLDLTQKPQEVAATVERYM